MILVVNTLQIHFSDYQQLILRALNLEMRMTCLEMGELICYRLLLE